MTTGQPETPEAVVERYRNAKQSRSVWEDHWQACYDFALPQRGLSFSQNTPGQKRTEKLFDATAPDGVDQLAASLLSQLTPPGSRWFGLRTGPAVEESQRADLADALELAAQVAQSHFDRSNFAVEVHQCYLDLVTCGTASLMFEEAAPGGVSAFRFQAVPLAQVVVEEGIDGRLDTTYRRTDWTVARFRHRFPQADLPGEIKRDADKNPDRTVPVIEAVTPTGQGFRYIAVLDTDAAGIPSSKVLDAGVFRSNPFINFRWQKAPGEVYGRSPVMKALPDIKTANKVVELILKNASIAVTGIWQADDDGVLNPATIKLTPGTIIPKAVGSKGLTPLEAPGKFDVSQLMLNDLRSGIRHALLADTLGELDAPRMTATEVVERSSQMARILGATYGRLQSELLTPLVTRAIAILRRRGEVADLAVDGQYVDLQYSAPLARSQARQDARNVMAWLAALREMGPAAMQSVALGSTARWLARAYGVPEELMTEDAVGSPGNGELPPDLGDPATLVAAGLGPGGDEMDPVLGISDLGADSPVSGGSPHV